MADYKDVQNRRYVYPNTELEASFVAGEADFPSGYELYMNVTSYYKVLEKYTDNLDHIHEYDYFLICVRKPEWAPDGPLTYKAIIVNDEYSLNYKAYYPSYTEITDLSQVEVGKNIYFTTHNPDYNATFPEGLRVTEYAFTIAENAIVYKFNMPDYDVEITTIEAPEPTYKSITVNDSYSLDYILRYLNGTEIDPSAVQVGKQVVFSTNDPSYTQTFPAGLEVEEYGTTQSGAAKYKFTMPDYDVEISTIPYAQTYTITVVNQDEAQFEMYDNDWNAITGPISEGTYVNALLKNRAYKLTSNDIYLIDQDWNTQYNQYHYTFIMPNSDITLTVSARAVNDIIISNPDSITTELYTTQWETITGQDVYEGQVIKFYVDDIGYQATFTGVDAVEELVDSKYKYTFRMPDADVDIVVEQRQIVTYLNVNLTDTYSINPMIFKNREGWSISDWHDLLEGDLVSIQWSTQGYALTSNDVSINTFWEGSESTWKGQFTMPSTDVDVTMDVGVLPAPISFNESSSTAYLQDTNVYPSLVNNESLTVSYGSSDTGVATIDPSTGEITLVDEGTTTISASFAGDSTFSSTTVTFTLTVVSGLRPRNIFPINNNTTASDILYDITKDSVIVNWTEPVTAGDQMALIDGNNVGSSYNAKVLYKDGLNNWTTLTTTQDTITYNDETMYCVKFTIPATVQDGDYLVYIGSSEDIYDVSINVGGVIYNENAAWWYTEEDQNNPGTYITKYPENCDLGLESRSGETYTINPSQTQEQGGSVGMYIVMPATDIEITRTDI